MICLPLINKGKAGAGTSFNMCSVYMGLFPFLMNWSAKTANEPDRKAYESMKRKSFMMTSWYLCTECLGLSWILKSGTVNSRRINDVIISIVSNES